MLPFQVKEFTSRSGDETVLLLDRQDGPAFWPNVFVTSRYVVAGRAADTRKKVLRSIGMARMWAGRRRGADCGHHRARVPVRTLRLPADHGAPSGSWLGGEREARRADMAAGGAQGSPEATEEEPALAQRRVLRPSAAGASEPRLVLRLRRGPDPRSSTLQSTISGCWAFPLTGFQWVRGDVDVVLCKPCSHTP